MKPTLLLAAAVALLASCDNAPILKPAAEHLTGKWNYQMIYRLTDGEWVEGNRDGRACTMTLRPDSSIYRTVTEQDGWTTLQSGTWSVDEDKRQFIMNNSPAGLVLLTADELVYTYGRAMDGKTGEMLDGAFRWRFKRTTPEKTMYLAERLLGKWNLEGTYEKKNDVWAKTAYGQPDESWFEYREDGTCTGYFRLGDKEMKMDKLFATNQGANQVRWMDKETGKEFRICAIDFENDYKTLNVYYDKNADPVTRKVYEGEFKDVFVLE